MLMQTPIQQSHKIVEYKDDINTTFMYILEDINTTFMYILEDINTTFMYILRGH